MPTRAIPSRLRIALSAPPSQSCSRHGSRVLRPSRTRERERGHPRRPARTRASRHSPRGHPLAPQQRCPVPVQSVLRDCAPVHGDAMLFVSLGPASRRSRHSTRRQGFRPTRRSRVVPAICGMRSARPTALKYSTGLLFLSGQLRRCTRSPAQCSPSNPRTTGAVSVILTSCRAWMFWRAFGEAGPIFRPAKVPTMRPPPPPNGSHCTCGYLSLVGRMMGPVLHRGRPLSSRDAWASLGRWGAMRRWT